MKRLTRQNRKSSPKWPAVKIKDVAFPTLSGRLPPVKTSVDACAAGHGTYVAEPARGLLECTFAKDLLTTEQEFADVCETRMIIETELAALAAARATAEDAAILNALIEKGCERLSGDPNLYRERGMEFHVGIANGSVANEFD
jgi:DNA-binding FadR family transcriptional regulator